MASQHDQVPDFDRGVAYWAATDASVTGVLGGYGERVLPSLSLSLPTVAVTSTTCLPLLTRPHRAHTHRGTPVPRLDATSSRLLILSLLPSLSTIPPPHLPSPSSSSSSPSSPTKPPRPSRPFRALDCGAGIGRVTRDTLLPLFDAVDLVEPVPAFVAQAERDARAGRDGWRRLAASAGSEGQGQGQGQRAVRIWKAGLQHFDPRRPAVPVVVEEASGAAAKVELAATIGRGDFAWPDPHRELDLAEAGYDLVRVSGPLPRRSSPASLSGAQTDPGWCALLRRAGPRPVVPRPPQRPRARLVPPPRARRAPHLPLGHLRGLHRRQGERLRRRRGRGGREAL